MGADSNATIVAEVGTFVTEQNTTKLTNTQIWRTEK